MNKTGEFKIGITQCELCGSSAVTIDEHQRPLCYKHAYANDYATKQANELNRSKDKSKPVGWTEIIEDASQPELESK